MAKKVLKLDIKQEYDFILLAIICSAKDYRLCFELNNALKINFKRGKDIELPGKKEGSAEPFSSYFYGKNNEQYTIIKNKGATASFIPEKKKIDYFLIIKNLSPDKNIKVLMEQIKNIEIINGIYEMDAVILKSAENFLLLE